MEAIINFLNELKRSDWYDKVPFHQRKYNDICVDHSSQTYQNKVGTMYSNAVIALINIPEEKYDIFRKYIIEVAECQEYFQFPSDELLESLMYDFEQSNGRNRGLKDDYDYLCFVRDCMSIQKYYLHIFSEKFSPSKLDEDVIIEADINKIDKKSEPIKGVEGLAKYLKIGKTKAQSIINSNVLQDNGVAYHVGRGWFFNPQKLDELLSNNPSLLYKRNK